MGKEDRPARTRLEQLLRQRRLTVAEFVRAFNSTAETTDSTGRTRRIASVSTRQATRWASGDVTRLPYPAACRVLESMFYEPAEALFEPSRVEVAKRDAAAENLDRSGIPQPLGSSSNVEEMTAMAAAESAEFGQYVEQTNVGPHTIEQFWSDLTRIVRAYPNRPVYPLFIELRHLRNRAFTLLEGRQTPGQSRELYLIAGTACAVLSNASFDLGNIPAAETQSRTAFLCAELAGHNALRAWVRGTQALVAYWDDRPRAAVELASDGWRYVPERGTARVRLASLEARARGKLRDHRGMEAALTRAAQARQAVVDDDEPGGMMAFPLAKQLAHTASGRLWLGGEANYRAAEQLAGSAVELYEADAPESRRLGEMSQAMLDFAVARLSQTDLEGAALPVEDVLEICGQRRIESVVRRLRQFSAALERPYFETSSLATNLRERIASSPIQAAMALPRGDQ